MIPLRPLLDALGDRPGPCLGAAFSTYGFDPRLFETRVLPAVLDLRCDPQEDATRFLQEARTRIQQVPVVVVADGHEVQAGRRVPFDLLEVHARTFHPKLTLLLFERSARLLVGSGNLTWYSRCGGWRCEHWSTSEPTRAIPTSMAASASGIAWDPSAAGPSRP